MDVWEEEVLRASDQSLGGRGAWVTILLDSLRQGPLSLVSTEYDIHPYPFPSIPTTFR